MTTLLNEWLNSSGILEHLASLSASSTINLIGQGASEARAVLSVMAPQLTLRAINVGDVARTSERADASALYIDRSQIADAITAGACSVVLDPSLAHWLVTERAMLKSLAMATAEWLLLPVCADPEPVCCFYSEEFSLEEPNFNDTTRDRWCWATSSGPAYVYLAGLGGLDAPTVSFSLTSGGPGKFLCRVEGQQWEFDANKGVESRFSIDLSRPGPLTRIEIKFSGESFQPVHGLDERQELFFNVSGLRIFAKSDLVSSAVLPPGNLERFSDRRVRRTLHDSGFFEVTNAGSPWLPLSRLAGVRSCFDYKQGFRYRDLYSDATFRGDGPPPRSYAFPAAWYQARRTPSPGSEWMHSNVRLAKME